MKFLVLLYSEKVIKIRKLISKGFLFLSILLLVFSFVAVGLAWFHAYKDGRVPDVWGTYEGNHGPWRYYQTGRGLIWLAFWFQELSFFSAIVSLLFKKTRPGIWLIITSILVFFAMIYTQYWLVD